MVTTARIRPSASTPVAGRRPGQLTASVSPDGGIPRLEDLTPAQRRAVLGLIAARELAEDLRRGTDDPAAA